MITKPKSTPIETIEDLQAYLQVAVQLEHATLPPYLTALYSIIPGSNPDAINVIRVVAVEEMLHMTLAANVLNAVGGSPDLLAPDFVPNYPTFLPTGEKDFKVSLEKFSRSAIDTFLKIERPAVGSQKKAAAEGACRCIDGIYYRLAGSLENKSPSFLPKVTLAVAEEELELHFYSIGQFYKAIQKGIIDLCDKPGAENIFTGDPSRQITSEYYYSGGGEVIPVKCRDTALAALELIAEQGEGDGGSIYDNEGELAHFYRFQQLDKEKYYQEHDDPGCPQGAKIDVDWDAVFPIQTNAKIQMYDGDPSIKEEAIEFNNIYASFLASINKALNGSPHLLLQAVGGMFNIKELMVRIMKNPFGDGSANAAPTFEIKQ